MTLYRYTSLPRSRTPMKRSRIRRCYGRPEDKREPKR